jgi:hypothetical protein
MAKSYKMTGNRAKDEADLMAHGAALAWHYGGRGLNSERRFSIIEPPREAIREGRTKNKRSGK